MDRIAIVNSSSFGKYFPDQLARLKKIGPIEFFKFPSDVNPKELDLASDTKRIQDLKGNHLLLFTSYWSIDWALEHNKGLELREFGTDW